MAIVLGAICALPHLQVAWCRWLEIGFWHSESLVRAKCWCSSFWAEVLCSSLEKDRSPKAELWLPAWLGLMPWALHYLGSSDHCFRELKASHVEERFIWGRSIGIQISVQYEKQLCKSQDPLHSRGAQGIPLTRGSLQRIPGHKTTVPVVFQ